MLDTDILSEIFRGKNEIVRQRYRAYLNEFPYISVSAVTYYEVIKGFARLGRVKDIETFNNFVEPAKKLLFDFSSAEIAGNIQADLQNAGKSIGTADVMIASIALSNDLTLSTGNQKHYKLIQSMGYTLKLDNWRTL